MARTNAELKGAAEERRAILARIRREMTLGVWVYGEVLVTWILDRDKRYNKVKGGLGRTRRGPRTQG